MSFNLLVSLLGRSFIFCLLYGKHDLQLKSEARKYKISFFLPNKNVKLLTLFISQMVSSSVKLVQGTNEKLVQ